MLNPGRVSCCLGSLFGCTFLRGAIWVVVDFRVGSVFFSEPSVGWGSTPDLEVSDMISAD